MGTKRPLALDYASHGAAKGWRANEHLIDALPYVDHVPLELRTVVDSLIEEEKCKSIKLPSDYLRELPAVRAPQFEEHPVLKTEYERCEISLRSMFASCGRGCCSEHIVSCSRLGVQGAVQAADAAAGHGPVPTRTPAPEQAW